MKNIVEQWGGRVSIFFSYAHFSHDLAIGLMPALLPFIRESVGLNYLEAGLLISAYTITAGFAQLPMGWLGDRYKRNVVAAIGLSGVGLMAIGVALSPSYYLMLAFMILMGIFGGCYHPSATPLLTSYFEPKRRGSAIGLHILGGSIGFTVGPLVGGLIGSLAGWRLAFIILSIPALVAAPLVMRHFTSMDQGNVSKETANKIVKSDTLSPKENQNFWQAFKPVAVIIFLAILIQTVSTSSLSYIPLYLVDKHNIDPANAAMLIAIVRAGGILGSLMGGWLSDHWGRSHTVVLSLTMTGPLLFVIDQASFNAVLIAAFVLFGMSIYIRQSAVSALLMDSVPSRFRSTALGIYMGLNQEWVSIAQPIAGYYMDIFGIVSVLNVIALGSLGLSLLPLVWAYYSTRKPKNTSESPKTIGKI